MNFKVFCLLFLLAAVTPVLAKAACIDVVDLDNELPPTALTDGGTVLHFSYDLQRDEYTLRWQRGAVESETFGPFPLTMSCQTPTVQWENSEFLVLERGCGTFCWYVKIFHLGDDAADTVPPYQKIERPLASDTFNNLLAYYADQDTIAVRNLLTGVEQLIPTAYACESYSGLCFTDVELHGSLLRYTWDTGQGGEIHVVTLAARLFE